MSPVDFRPAPIRPKRPPVVAELAKLVIPLTVPDGNVGWVAPDPPRKSIRIRPSLSIWPIVNVPVFILTFIVPVFKTSPVTILLPDVAVVPLSDVKFNTPLLSMPFAIFINRALMLVFALFTNVFVAVRPAPNISNVFALITNAPAPDASNEFALSVFATFNVAPSSTYFSAPPIVIPPGPFTFIVEFDAVRFRPVPAAVVPIVKLSVRFTLLVTVIVLPE